MVSTKLKLARRSSCRKRSDFKTKSRVVRQSGKFERHAGEIGYNAFARRLEREHEDALDQRTADDADFIVGGDPLYAIWSVGGDDDASIYEEEEEEAVEEEEDEDEEEEDEWASDECYTSEEEEEWASDDSEE